MPGCSEKTCSAVGLRHLFWLQMKRTRFTLNDTPTVIETLAIDVEQRRLKSCADRANSVQTIHATTLVYIQGELGKAMLTFAPRRTMFPSPPSP